MIARNVLEEIRTGLRGKTGDKVTITLSTGQCAFCFSGRDAATRTADALSNQPVAITGVEQVTQDTYCFIA